MSRFKTRNTWTRNAGTRLAAIAAALALGIGAVTAQPAAADNDRGRSAHRGGVAVVIASPHGKGHGKSAHRPPGPRYGWAKAHDPHRGWRGPAWQWPHLHRHRPYHRPHHPPHRHTSGAVIHFHFGH